MPTEIRISIIGCGAIGTEIAKYIDLLKDPCVKLACIVDTDRFKAEMLQKKLRRKPKITDLDEAIQESDLVVEAANRRIVPELVTKAINQGKDVMIMSVAGLVDREDLFSLARRKNCCIYLPSGAIAGIDGLKSAMIGKVYKVSLTTTKPPKALENAPYVIEKKISLKNIKKPKVLFKGSARDAIRGFPANVNICVTLSYAGIGLDKTKVTIIADPKIKVNKHELVVEGEFGKLKCEVLNVPSKLNPRTSFLAALSSVATFKRIVDPIKIGT
jgi:aspartate dehydrogenase